MHRHGVIWFFTALVAAMAFMLVFARNLNDSAPEVAASQEDTVDAMVALLEKDPPARGETTRALVSRVAAMVEQGELATAEGYYALALRLYGQRRLDEAEKAYQQAISAKPTWSWPHNGLGITLSAMGRFDEAEAAFRRAIELDPGWSRPHNDLAIVLRNAGRFDEALERAEEAIALDPENPATHNNYGNLLMALGRINEAEAAYRKASELDPGHPAPLYNLACLACRKGDGATALELLERAVSADPAFIAEAMKDPDLDPLRGDPRFTALMNR